MPSQLQGKPKRLDGTPLVLTMIVIGSHGQVGYLLCTLEKMALAHICYRSIIICRNLATLIFCSKLMTFSSEFGYLH
jgi:hypothetical protein